MTLVSKTGQIIKLKELSFKERFFKVVATNGDIEWMITNHPGFISTQVTKAASDVRWQIEHLHRELKQLTGTEKCQCRKARAQRTHLALCYQAWLAIRVKATSLKKTMYAVINELYGDFLRAQLRLCSIPAL